MTITGNSSNNSGTYKHQAVYRADYRKRYFRYKGWSIKRFGTINSSKNSGTYKLKAGYNADYKK